MFTVLKHRRIDTHLEYVINVYSLTQPKMNNPYKQKTVKHLDEAVKIIEEYKDQYCKIGEYALFVDIATYIHTTRVRVEAFWVDN